MKFPTLKLFLKCSELFSTPAKSVLTMKLTNVEAELLVLTFLKSDFQKVAENVLEVERCKVFPIFSNENRFQVNEEFRRICC